MGKISSGCDIAIIINGDEDNAIRMGSNLSYEQVSFQAIAEQLMKQEGIRLSLRDILKLEISTREVTKEEIETSGIVHNSTVQNIASKYPSFDWSNVDQSTKLLCTNWFNYFGQDMSNVIIWQRNPKSGLREKIIVLDPSDLEQVSKLNSYLIVQQKLNTYSDETKSIVDQSQISNIVSQLGVIKIMLQEQAKKFKELQSKEEALTKNEQKKLVELSKAVQSYEKFNEHTPKYPKELLEDFLDNYTKYQGLHYTVNGQAKSIVTELNNVIKAIEGKNVKEAIYQDVFANEIVSNAKYDSGKELYKVNQSDFIQALRIKLADMRMKRESMDSKGEAYTRSIKLSSEIDKFLGLENKTPKHWNQIINLLIDQTDDEFSYSLNSIGKGVIYLNNIPRTLEQRYSDFTNKSVSVMKPQGTYKGFTIYLSPNGGYYFDRHVLTTKSYGKKYKSKEECMSIIDSREQNNPISQHSLIEFKTRGDRDVVWIPNKFTPGQIVKSLNLRFKLSQPLNEIEEDLIYNTGLKNSNTLNKFYNYVMSILDTKSPDYAKKELTKAIDTAEKAACFIYALNESQGVHRSPIDLKTFSELLKRISDAKYEYFVVESVGNYTTVGSKMGLKTYKTTDMEGTKQKGTHTTLLTPIQSVEIQNSLVQIDEKTQRPLPSIRLLNDLADKIRNKLGINVNIITQSDLEELFSQWGEEVPSEVHGFIRNGEIYINSSNSTDETLFHEYVHIMLGVLKAKNFDNYYDLIQLAVNTTRGDRMKTKKREHYPNLADSDLNEEVFADMFAEYMSGRDLGMFLNGLLKDSKRAVDDKMGSIFGAQRITEDFYNANINNVFRQFGYDLGQIMNEGNGLELEVGTSYRQASNWISSQIEKYKDSNEIGIYENCD